MKKSKSKIWLVFLALFPIYKAVASDHLDSQYIDELPKLDIGDLFVWTGFETGSPVFFISLNPLTLGEQPASKLLLSQEAVYEFKLDTDGDNIADLAYKLSVSGDAHPQDVVLYRAEGDDAIANVIDAVNKVLKKKGDVHV